MTKIVLDVTHHLEGLVGKALCTHKQGLALVVPYILESEFPDLKVLYLDKGLLVLEDSVGTRYKVFCSSSNTFNVAPSYTKGIGRSKDGVSVKTELEQTCQSLILVNFNKPKEWDIYFQNLKAYSLEWDGVITIE